MTESPPPDSGHEPRRSSSSSDPGGRVRRSKIRRRSPGKLNNEPSAPDYNPWKAFAILFAVIAFLSTTALIICLITGFDGS